MDQTANYLPYEKTGYFTKIVADYLSGSTLLQPFYAHAPNLSGIQNAIAARKGFANNRFLLTEVLQEQYAGLPVTDQLKANMEALSEPNTFTITTAHQPNIFTGPLYFIYKIMHVIKLADDLKKQLPEYRFVPVYYMGSEDADLDELGFVSVGGQKLVWETKQTGAVGRMKVDKALLALIETIYGQAGVLPFGNELVDLFKQCYTAGKTIKQATLELVNELFGAYGLVVLIPDHARLKSAFRNVVEKELLEGFSHKIVSDTIAEISRNYKVQAGGREINLFYLLDDKRERIEWEGENYVVKTLALSFSREAILLELDEHPERFSANVILRGAFQETILPDIAFIGGGGELAYWLELKNVFDAVQIPYPVLVLRNSFLMMGTAQAATLSKLGFSELDLFGDELALVNTLVKRETTNQLSLQAEIQQAHDYYAHLRTITEPVDKSLSEHLLALEKKAIKRLTELEKKLLRAERNKYEVQQLQIAKLKQELFPDKSLQERVDNLSLYYARYGKAWLQMVYEVSTGLNEGFGVVVV